MKAVLALEDGTVFEGEAFGASGEACGEVVFNTSMTGYQEILTDPSYKGQMVVMTYPMIGNYGVNKEDVESSKPQVEGFIVREYCPFPSNSRSQGSLGDYLKEHNIIAMQGVDTRALTLHTRLQGSLRGVMSTLDLDGECLVKKARASPRIEGRDLVEKVTCPNPIELVAGQQSCSRPACGGMLVPNRNSASVRSPKFVGMALNGEQEALNHVVVYDFGVKQNILRILSSLGCKVTVVPARTEAETVLGLKPDGIVLSNGPGDPAALGYAIGNVKALIGSTPVLGICLGHQILALALGGKTYKLKFGHHGGNHPVKDLKTGRVEITVQNHSFAVDRESLPNEIEVTHLNLNDGTVEALRHRSLPIFSVQYHPEASPGPQDASHLLGRFVGMVRQNNGSSKSRWTVTKPVS